MSFANSLLIDAQFKLCILKLIHSHFLLKSLRTRQVLIFRILQRTTHYWAYMYFWLVLEFSQYFWLLLVVSLLLTCLLLLLLVMSPAWIDPRVPGMWMVFLTSGGAGLGGGSEEVRWCTVMALPSDLQWYTNAKLGLF